jgi:hypothetical protein
MKFSLFLYEVLYYPILHLKSDVDANAESDVSAHGNLTGQSGPGPPESWCGSNCESWEKLPRCISATSVALIEKL